MIISCCLFEIIYLVNVAHEKKLSSSFSGNQEGGAPAFVAAAAGRTVDE